MVNKTLQLFIITLLFSLSFLCAGSIGYCNPNLPGGSSCEIEITTPSFVNYSLVNVNNSLYWQGRTGTDGSWLTGISTYNSSYANLNSSQWIPNGNNITNRNTGNVGIGSVTPSERLSLYTLLYKNPRIKPVTMDNITNPQAIDRFIS